MLKFITNSEYFQIILSDKKSNSNGLVWNEASLADGIAYNLSCAFIATDGDNYSYSSSIAVTILDSNEKLNSQQCKDYMLKGSIKFENDRDTLFITGAFNHSEIIRIRLDKRGYSFDIYVNPSYNPRKILIKLLDANITSTSTMLDSNQEPFGLSD